MKLILNIYLGLCGLALVSVAMCELWTDTILDKEYFIDMGTEFSHNFLMSGVVFEFSNSETSESIFVNIGGGTGPDSLLLYVSKDRRLRDRYLLPSDGDAKNEFSAGLVRAAKVQDNDLDRAIIEVLIGLVESGQNREFDQVKILFLTEMFPDTDHYELFKKIFVQDEITDDYLDRVVYIAKDDKEKVTDSYLASLILFNYKGEEWTVLLDDNRDKFKPTLAPSGRIKWKPEPCPDE